MDKFWVLLLFWLFSKFFLLGNFINAALWTFPVTKQFFKHAECSYIVDKMTLPPRADHWLICRRWHCDLSLASHMCGILQVFCLFFLSLALLVRKLVGHFALQLQDKFKLSKYMKTYHCIVCRKSDDKKPLGKLWWVDVPSGQLHYSPIGKVTLALYLQDRVLLPLFPFSVCTDLLQQICLHGLEIVCWVAQVLWCCTFLPHSFALLYSCSEGFSLSHQHSLQNEMMILSCEGEHKIIVFYNPPFSNVCPIILGFSQSG